MDNQKVARQLLKVAKELTSAIDGEIIFGYKMIEWKYSPLYLGLSKQLTKAKLRTAKFLRDFAKAAKEYADEEVKLVYADEPMSVEGESRVMVSIVFDLSPIKKPSYEYTEIMESLSRMGYKVVKA